MIGADAPLLPARGIVPPVTKRKAKGADDVKTSFWLPRPLLRAAKLRALEEHRQLREVLIAALQAYLSQPKMEGKQCVAPPVPLGVRQELHANRGAIA